MRRTLSIGVLAGAAMLCAAATAPAAAQEEEPGANLLAVGEMAPDIALPGATRYGLLENPVTLSDYRGETVVLAFFFRVRTRG
jgi:peroxiredoxin Q/BCP